jgi:hypothetical protein
MWFSICAVLGLGLLACGLLVPMHLRAVDAGVLERAGRSGPALLEEGRALAGEQKLGTARMLMQAARLAEFPGWDRLGESLTNLAQQNPAALTWGDDARVKNLFAGNAPPPADGAQPFTDFIIRQDNREAALTQLHDSPVPAVQELLRSRSLNNTALFPPSSSASGQAFDAAVCISGLLLDNNHVTAGLRREIDNLGAQANRGGDTKSLESALMDFMSLGERFNWDQLVAFVAQIPDTGTLHQLAGQARNAGTQLPILFAAVELSGKPAAVAGYLARFSQTGLKTSAPVCIMARAAWANWRNAGSAFITRTGNGAPPRLGPLAVSLMGRRIMVFNSRNWRWSPNGWPICSADFFWRRPCILRGRPSRRSNVRCKCVDSI